MKLSICIPTYNRARHLNNCLYSILNNKEIQELNFEICISNNNSNDNTKDIVWEYSQNFPIKYSENSSNLGVARNVLKVVEMAVGEFVWLLGDDDLLFPHSIKTILNILNDHPRIDYFYVNASHLTTEFVHSFPQPFDLANLPENMERFSKWEKEAEYDFLDLIHPNISFDFLGGMFLAVFRRELWINKTSVLDKKALSDPKVFSAFDNTFAHLKIFANAFSRSKAYFYPEPLSICLTGAREWSQKYSLVRSVRLVEALEEYRKNGLPLIRYFYSRNFALSYFFQDVVYMYLDKEERGWYYINPLKLILNNLLFPNMYLSVIYAVFRKVSNLIRSRNQNG